MFGTSSLAEFGLFPNLRKNKHGGPTAKPKFRENRHRHRDMGKHGSESGVSCFEWVG
jgi:hypothetical protein